MVVKLNSEVITQVPWACGLRQKKFTMEDVPDKSFVYLSFNISSNNEGVHRDCLK